jgi:hypothetical protein
MKLSQRLGFVVTATYLIVEGVINLVDANIRIPSIVVSLLAIAAGGILLLSLSGRRDRHLGVLLLGVWLVLRGIIPLINLNFTGLSLIMGILALLAGVFILVSQVREKRRGLGYLLLAIWLLLFGALSVFTFSFQYQALVLAILAIGAGILILIRR